MNKVFLFIVILTLGKMGFAQIPTGYYNTAENLSGEPLRTALYNIINGHSINEGFLVSGMLIPLVMPVDCPLWMVAVGTAFAVVIGRGHCAATCGQSRCWSRPTPLVSVHH